MNITTWRLLSSVLIWVMPMAALFCMIFAWHLFFQKIPNETIRRLFYDYIKEGYEETGVFSLDRKRKGKGNRHRGLWKN